MSLQEAAFFYGEYSELLQEIKELELSDNFDNTSMPQEILSCPVKSTDL